MESLQELCVYALMALEGQQTRECREEADCPCQEARQSREEKVVYLHIPIKSAFSPILLRPGAWLIRIQK